MVSELLAVAKVGRSHGLKGEFRVWMLTEGADTLEHTPRVVLEGPDKRRREFQVRSVRASSRGVIVQLAGIASREEADAWKHGVVHIYPSDLPPLPEGEWYEFELHGMPVVDGSGQAYGTVVGLIDNGGHDVLVVEDGDSEFQIPFVDGMVEVTEDQVVIDPPEGLIEATRSTRSDKGQ